MKIYRSELELDATESMSRDQLYDTFKEELNKCLGVDDHRKLLVFMSCTEYKPPPHAKDFTVEDIQSYVTGHAALGGINAYI